MRVLTKFIVTVGTIIALSLAGCSTAYAREPERPWQQLVVEGAIPGYSVIHKFGENPDIDTATEPETVWSYGGQYTYSTTADIDSISSSDVDDVQPIIIQGLDENYDLLTQTVVLTGQTRSAIPIPYLRVFRAWNSGNTDLEGTMYTYVDTTLSIGVPVDATKVRAIIRLDPESGSAGQTEMSMFTVPRNHIAYIYSGYFGLSRGGNLATAEFVAKGREFGGIFRVVYRASVIGQGLSFIGPTNVNIPRLFPAKADLEFVCTNVGANDTGVFSGFTIVLKNIYP